jgi:2-polyprenyl-3-methyl-5-hydroxy-6-metoxy-1,4-benzoquinol methylase
MPYKESAKKYSPYLKNFFLPFIIFLTFSLLRFSPHLFFYKSYIEKDWRYFNGLSHFINLSIFKYHLFPIYDPYVCGGADFLANPQSYVFSPFIILYLIFHPYLSNVLSLIICSIIGGFSMMKLLEYFSVNKKTAIAGALIFLSGNWFYFHFLEGHLVFRSFYLIPLVIYFIFNLGKDIKYTLYLSLIMSFFILDGGIYAFNFSIFFLIIAIILKTPKFSEIFKIIKNNLFKTLFICAAFLLTTSAKTIPTLLAYSKLPPHLHFYTYSLSDFIMAFFYPFNFLWANAIQDDFFLTGYRMHEYACYIGFSWLLPAIYFLIKKEKINDFKNLLAFLLISLWIGIGFGYIFNPWTVFNLTPILNKSHVQSRFLIFFWIFFIIILAKILSASKNKYLWTSLILLELNFFGLYSSILTLNNSQKLTSIDYKKENISTTVPYIMRPEIYFSESDAPYASKECYDNAAYRNRVLSNQDLNYNGEVHDLTSDNSLENIAGYPIKRIILDDKPNISTAFSVVKKSPPSPIGYYPRSLPLILIKERSMEKISAYYLGAPNKKVVFNTNYLLGWAEENSSAYKTSSANSLLAVTFAKSPTKMVIKYKPKYIPSIFITFTLGIILFSFLIITRNNKRMKKAFQYDEIPAGFYDKILLEAKGIRSFWHYQKFDTVLRVLSSIRNGKILDIGCSSGSFLGMVKKENFNQQIGVDLAYKQIEYAKKYQTNYRKFIKIDDAQTVFSNFDNNFFDAVTLIEVIEHLTPQEIEKIFATTTRVLKPGGQLVITTPNYLSTWPILEILISKFSKPSYEDQHITKFHFFNVITKLRKIYPNFDNEFSVKLKTSSHLLSFVIAGISNKLAKYLSKTIAANKWRVPFGALLIIKIEKK